MKIYYQSYDGYLAAYESGDRFHISNVASHRQQDQVVIPDEDVPAVIKAMRSYLRQKNR